MSQSANYTIDQPPNTSACELAQSIYELTCRTDFSKPGFALVRQPQIVSSTAHRQEIVELKNSLSAIHQQKTDMKLGWFTMSRFDQKNTTKLHRDGGPAQSLLILGYEPSLVQSQISIADYSMCAHKSGMNPEELLERHNPMYEEGLEMLTPYTCQLTNFDTSIFQILVVNNSSATFGDGWQGVLHSAMVESSEASRIINSTSVCPMLSDEIEEVSTQRVLQFFHENSVGIYE